MDEVSTSTEIEPTLQPCIPIPERLTGPGIYSEIEHVSILYIAIILYGYFEFGVLKYIRRLNRLYNNTLLEIWGDDHIINWCAWVATVNIPICSVMFTPTIQYTCMAVHNIPYIGTVCDRH